jgi:hypothetical protein
VPKSVGAHSCCVAKSACAKGPSRVLYIGHTLSINPGMHSRVKHNLGALCAFRASRSLTVHNPDRPN